MSATLGYILLFLIMITFDAFFVWQISRIVIDKKDYLDQVIKTLDRDKAISEKLNLIKSYEVTIEQRLNEIEKAVINNDDNDSLTACENISKKKSKK